MGTDKNPVQEMAEKVNDLVNAGAEPEPAPGTEPSGEPAPAGGEAAADQTVEIDGEKFTLEQLRELRQAGLRQEDYTRKTQTLADDRRALEAERKTAQQQIERYEAILKGLTQEPEATIDDQDVPPAVRKLLADRDRKIDQIRTRLEEIREAQETREVEQDQARTNEFIVTHAEAEIRKLMADTKLPDELFTLVRNEIAMRNPDAVDLITRELTEQSVRSAIRREFTAVYGTLDKWKRGISASTVQNLKKEPPKKPAAAAAPAKPGEPEKKPALNRRGWDSHAAITETVDKMSALLGKGDDYT